MTNLTPNLKLHRKPNIRVDINSSNNMQIRLADGLYEVGPHGLAVLDAFYQPTSLSEAIQKLSSTVAGAQDWMALTTMTVKLYKAGVLQEEIQRTPQEIFEAKGLADRITLLKVIYPARATREGGRPRQ